MTSGAGSCASAVVSIDRRPKHPRLDRRCTGFRDKPEIRHEICARGAFCAAATLIGFGGHPWPRRWGIHEGDSDIHCGRLRGGVRDRRMGAGACTASASARQPGAPAPRHRRPGSGGIWRDSLYARVFKTTLHQQPGSRHTAVLRAARRPAAGLPGRIHRHRCRAGDRASSIGHYCVLGARAPMRCSSAPRSQAAGLPAVPTGAGGLLVCGRTRTVSNCNCFSRLPDW